ncbi:hypothetical protein VNI00_002500 [Paramarasmius palmivorus]|uniref:F-box domain-containing protein n=1 Tax=Paramarasmius palmivorus TaxID=297713 RepID=A0AAW0DZ99_9AGAR
MDQTQAHPPHPALCMPEIVLIIFQFCEPSELSYRNFALVSPLWFSTYVREQWHTVRDPSCLIAATCNFETKQCADMFARTYAPRIRRLDFDERCVDPMALDRVFDILSSGTSSTGVLLPMVTSFRLVNPVNPSRLQKFLHGTIAQQIMDLIIMDDFQDSRCSNRSLSSRREFADLLACIPERIPGLKRLEITLQGIRDIPVYDKITRSMTKLEYLRLPSSAYLPGFDFLLASQKTRVLAFGPSKDVMEMASYHPSPDYIFVPATLLPDSLQHLTEIELSCCTLPVAMRFFESFTGGCLKRIAITIHVGRMAPEIPSPDALRHLHLVISQSSLLEDIYLGFTADRKGFEVTVLAKQDPPLSDLITERDLWAFTTCAKLKSFRFHHIYPVSISVSGVLALTKCWPQLRTLAICPEPVLPLDQFPRGMKHLDWGAYHFISRHCPLLVSLEVLIIDTPGQVYSPALMKAIRKSTERLRSLCHLNLGSFCTFPEVYEGGSTSVISGETRHYDADFYSVDILGGDTRWLTRYLKRPSELD